MAGRSTKRIKLKVARWLEDAELALIASPAKRLPNTRLILDANGGWQRERHCAFASSSACPTDYLEEPQLRWPISPWQTPRASISPWMKPCSVAPFGRRTLLAALVIKPTLIGGSRPARRWFSAPGPPLAGGDLIQFRIRGAGAVEPPWAGLPSSSGWIPPRRSANHFSRQPVSCDTRGCTASTTPPLATTAGVS